MKRSSSRRIALAALVAVGALAAALLVFAPARNSAPVGEPAAQATPTQALPTQMPARGSGSISGEVILRGSPPEMRPLKLGADPVCAAGSRSDEQVVVSDGKLANVLVRVVDAPAEPPPSVPAMIDQRRCVFWPRILAVVRGQSLEIRNADPTLHNVHAYAGGSTLFNYAQPAGAPAVQRARTDRLGIIQLKCDVHPWMAAFVHVEESSHFAVTGTDGAFSIPGLAARSYEVEAWHERFGTKRAKIDVAEGQAAHLTFSYSTDDRG